MNKGGRFIRTEEGELIPVTDEAPDTQVPEDPPAETEED